MDKEIWILDVLGGDVFVSIFKIDLVSIGFGRCFVKRYSCG